MTCDGSVLSRASAFRFQRNFPADTRKIFIKCNAPPSYPHLNPSHFYSSAAHHVPVPCSYIVDASMKLMTSSSSECRATLALSFHAAVASHVVLIPVSSIFALNYRVFACFRGSTLLHRGFGLRCSLHAHHALRTLTAAAGSLRPPQKSHTSLAATRCCPSA